MMSRLMDLVVLVAEISQETDKSFRELDAELGRRGYSSEEIEQAVFWLSSRGELGLGGGPHGRRAVRVLSEWERMSVSAECYGYLLRLLNLGIIDGSQFEKIIARAIPVGTEKIQLNEVKEIACAVVFNHRDAELDEEAFDPLEEDLPGL